MGETLTGPETTGSVGTSASAAAPRAGLRLDAGLLDQIPDALVVADDLRRVICWNTAAERMYGIPAAEALGKPLDSLNRSQWIVPQDEVEAAEGLRLDGEWRGRNIHRRRDGRELVVESSVVVLHDSAGEPIGTLSVIRDVTQRVQLEKSLAESDDLRSRFVHNVSHELKTPITSILYAARNLLRTSGTPLPEKTYQYLKVIEGEALRLSATVEDVLDSRQAEGKALKLSTLKLPLARLVERRAEVIQGHLKERGLRLDLSVDRKSGFILGDPPKMERVTQNLLSNAMKFTRPGGDVRICVRRDPDSHDHVLFAVEDSGIGIPADALPKIAQPYFRAGNHPAGTGLGLAISTEIVRLHGGSLAVTSPRPGADSGTVVSVRLPVTTPAVVLLIDEGEATRRLAERQLSAYGYLVILADTTEESLRQAEAERPDCLVVSVDAGLGVVLRLQCHPSLRDTPMLAVADRPLEETSERMLCDLGVPVLGKTRVPNAVVDGVEDAVLSQSVFRHASST